MNYSLLKRQLLIALRGHYSQMDLSKKMGFTFNQVGKWESNAKIMKWTDFYDLCHFLDVKLDPSICNTFLSLNENNRDPLLLINTLHFFYSAKSLEQIAELLNCHLSVVRRWYSGAVCPDIESVFALMNLRNGLLEKFIAQLTSIENIPVISEINDFQKKQIEFAVNNPDVSTIESCFTLVGYKNLKEHSDAFISQKTNIPEAEVKKCIQFLLENNRIEFENRKFKINTKLKSNITGDKFNLSKMRKHWIKKNLERFNTPDGIPANPHNRPNFGACFKFNASKKEMDQIFQILHECFEKIRQLENAEPQPEEEIRLLLIDTFSPDDVPFN